MVVLMRRSIIKTKLAGCKSRHPCKTRFGGFFIAPVTVALGVTDWGILLLHAQERPDFINLHAFDGQAAHCLVLIGRTGSARIGQQLQDGVLALSSHADRRIDVDAFGEAVQDLYAVFDGKFVRL